LKKIWESAEEGLPLRGFSLKQKQFWGIFNLGELGDF
jgi:hypothetical protein